MHSNSAMNVSAIGEHLAVFCVLRSNCSQVSVKILILPLDSATPISVVRRIFWRSVGIYHVHDLDLRPSLVTGYPVSKRSNI